ncbi:dihydropteroate synthase [Aureimonas fodinaquatilis]|uniref:Dihydropteroate synthase n=1 Tax=Aureimonas fodinaquatilis TaxID=2565783 RepID=A0A5B0DS85_9HYPH|nr:DUF6513 domain-containing protein [Aureimonas fodinaquatilis]KAA0968611.1 dihydropteroate synthase [Aureimonas fodinaquatilis]
MQGPFSGQKLLFLTGHLALQRLHKVLAELPEPDFTHTVVDIGVKVAALMTGEIIERRLPRPVDATLVVVPGRCRADLDRLARHFGLPFVRGPDEIADLPEFLGRKGGKPDLSQHDMRIFSEIVDASALTPGEILRRALAMRAAGADVIDLGCLPDTPFPHLEKSIALLKQAGLTVSVDSADRNELLRANRAGADYLLSLHENSLDVALEGNAVPVLIPEEPRDLDSLLRAMDKAEAMGLNFIADPVLDPIHFGFSASLARYHRLHELRPGVDVMMGTGNLTELTQADTSGITAMLLGIASELSINNLLVVHVSAHTRATLQEHDLARRIMFAAKADGALPKGYSAGLSQVHDIKPFANTSAEIAEQAAMVRDRNYRIETAEDGIHLYTRGMHVVEQNAFAAFPHLEVKDDPAHAFYLGAELQRAEIAWRLGKRFAQDEPLNFGVATPEDAQEDRTRLAEAGHTLKAGKDKSGKDEA